MADPFAPAALPAPDADDLYGRCCEIALESGALTQVDLYRWTESLAACASDNGRAVGICTGWRRIEMSSGWPKLLDDDPSADIEPAAAEPLTADAAVTAARDARGAGAVVAVPGAGVRRARRACLPRPAPHPPRPETMFVQALREAPAPEPSPPAVTPPLIARSLSARLENDVDTVEAVLLQCGVVLGAASRVGAAPWAARGHCPSGERARERPLARCQRRH